MRPLGIVANGKKRKKKLCINIYVMKKKKEEVKKINYFENTQSKTCAYVTSKSHSLYCYYYMFWL